ncbi:hypothetical protein H7X65_00935 [Candidatus Parcubacteria bacterium]|nr:hypothetical protein [Candidatus Parcubacteria bacterium]
MNNTYYQDKIATLPENLQYAVMMSNWKESLVAIQTKFKLHIDQTQVLEDSTIKLMFGDIDAPDFINHMFNDAHINSETAADILLEVDLKILKNIRERLELIEEGDKESEEIENILLSDEEKEAKIESENYADYYKQAADIRQQTEEDLLKEGILPDGSNITDEMLGITREIPTDVLKEKNDLLNEIDAPSKSFTNTVPTAIPKAPEPEPIPVDHQIENVSIEEPFHEEDIVPEMPLEKVEIKQAPIKTTLDSQPEIKKPITINLDDIYREPIE